MANNEPIFLWLLTHWGQVTHICIGNLTIIGSDHGLVPGWHHTIIWTNAGILLIGPLGTYFSEILIKILSFSFKKKCLKVFSAKWQPFWFLWPFHWSGNFFQSIQLDLVQSHGTWRVNIKSGHMRRTVQFGHINTTAPNCSCLATGSS